MSLLNTINLLAQVTPNQSDLQLKVDQYLMEGVSNGFSGSILIVQEGAIVLNKAYGFADKENEILYTTETVAPIGSVTKQFTATAILKLEELKKLKVSDSLGKYFPNLPFDKKDITIHQLLTHSSGFVNRIGENDFDDISEKKYFKTLFATELLHKPAMKYAYSNAGYSVLAKLSNYHLDWSTKVFFMNISLNLQV